MNYWVCGHTEEAAREKAAARFKVSKEKISLKWGKIIVIVTVLQALAFGLMRVKTRNGHTIHKLYMFATNSDINQLINCHICHEVFFF